MTNGQLANLIKEIVEIKSLDVALDSSDLLDSLLLKRNEHRLLEIKSILTTELQKAKND